MIQTFLFGNVSNWQQSKYHCIVSAIWANTPCIFHRERNGNVPKVDEAWREPLPLDLRGGWKSCVLRCAFIVAYVVTRSMHPTVFILCTVLFLHDVNLPRPIGASLDTPLWLARAGGIFAWYHKVIIYHALPYRHVYSPRTTRATLAQVKRCALHL